MHKSGSGKMHILELNVDLDDGAQGDKKYHCGSFSMKGKKAQKNCHFYENRMQTAL